MPDWFNSYLGIHALYIMPVRVLQFIRLFRKEAMKKNKYSIMDFVYPKDKDYFITSVYNVEDGSINFEVRLVKKDGTIIYCLINGNHVMAKNGNYTISAVFVDITRQKKMQEMLRMDRERYRVASELSNDVLFEYYVINDEMIFSDKFKELFGRDTIMDNFVRDCYLRRDMVHPDDYGLYLDFVLNYLRVRVCYNGVSPKASSQ